MKLYLRLWLWILPLIVGVSTFQGFIAYTQARDLMTEQYRQRLDDRHHFVLLEHIEDPYRVLVNSGLEKAANYTARYQQAALEALKRESRGEASIQHLVYAEGEPATDADLLSTAELERLDDLQLVAESHFAPWGWRLVTVGDRAVIEDRLHTILQTTVISASASMIALIVLLRLLFGRMVDRPISQLLGISERIAARQSVNTEIQAGYPRDIAQLFESLQNTSMLIRDYSQEIEHADQRIRIATDSAQIGIWDLNLATDALVWDDWMYRLYGITEDTFAGAYAAWQQGLHPDDAANAEQTLKAAIAGDGLFRAEFRVVHPDGTVRWLKASAWVRQDPFDGMQHMIGVNQDITAQRTAEQQLKERQTQLEAAINELNRSNEELLNFAYVASHDLKEPLRSISGYLQLIKRRYNDRLDENGKEFIGFAVAGSERMSAIIEDLLAYSRVARQQQAREVVDLNQVALEVRQKLGKAIAECDAQIEYGDLPRIRAAKLHMTQLLQNLVENAIKYRDPQRRPVIRVEAQRDEQRQGWYLRVADNGIGIEAQYLDRIFEIFERLHQRDQYSGNGIGLAICKRIAQRHGGDIRAESIPGEGSVFEVFIADEVTQNEKDLV